MEAKKQIEEIIKNISEENAKKLLEFIDNNFELVATEHDKKIFERGLKEIENGEYEPFKETE